MIENKLRIGNFTSSEIYRLLSLSKDGKSFGKPALEYIQECNYERSLMRSIDCETSAKPLHWGTLLEGFMFEKQLDTSYQLVSQESVVHPEHPFWVGSPDGTKHVNGAAKKVTDIKCPFTLKSFCQLASCNTSEDLRNNHKDGEKYYWQLVSNAILLGLDEAELIVYAPYEDELPAIQTHIQELSELGSEVRQYNFIMFSDGKELPLQKRNSKLKSPHILSFEIPQTDKDLLTECVIKAGELLDNNFNPSEL